MSRSDNECEDDDRRRRRRDDDNSDDYQDGDNEDDDRPRRRRSDELDPLEFIVPTDVSGWSIVVCYVGLNQLFSAIRRYFPGGCRNHLRNYCLTQAEEDNYLWPRH
jgi:hypothetical protein